MTFRQFLTTVNHIPEFDVNRILRWDVGRALRRPVRNPLLKFACGWLIGIMVFGLGSIGIGFPLSDQTVRLLGVAVGVLFAITPNKPSLQCGENGTAV